MAIKPRMSNHVTIDWCHLCGERVPNTVDIDCADLIGAISRGRER